MGMASKRSGLVASAGDVDGIKADEINTDSNVGDSLTDGALDTLGIAIRIMGEESFPLDTARDADRFPLICTDFARHVENGAAVPAYDIELADTGRREWSVVQRFIVDRRRNENKYVTSRLSGYRDIVGELVAGLRDMGRRDQSTEAAVLGSLTSVQEAISKDTFGENDLPRLKGALAEAIAVVSETFSEQKQSYENQLQDLNDRMANLRDDLVAVREEMKLDSLTQTFNRGAFDAAIKQSLNMHFFSRQSVCLLFIDLDNFKWVNDTHGHTAGDAVLRAVGGKLVRSFIRKNDLVARYGGDEFAVILGDTKSQDAAMLVERFLNTMRNLAVEIEGESIRVSCSVGFTEIKEEDTVESFINRADKALFEAKTNGRDRGVCGE